jgi:hypothetical protein
MKLGGERTDGEALQSLNRSDINGAGQDSFTGTEAAGLASR